MAPGYPAAAAAMVITIILLITLKIVHPPAVATALGFSFLTSRGQAIIAFVAALGVIALLVVLQRLAVWTLQRVTSEDNGP